MGGIRRLAVVTISAAILAACGRSPFPDVELARAPDLTARVHRTQVTLRVTVHDLPRFPTYTSTAVGAYDFDLDRGSYRWEAPASEATDQITVDFVQDGTMLYGYTVAPPNASASNRWLRFDTSLPTRSEGFRLSSDRQIRSANPTLALAAVRGAGDADRVETTTLHGVRVVHLTTLLNLAAAVDRAQPEEAERVRKDIGDLYGGVRLLPAEVWLDAEGRLRAMEYTLTFLEPQPGDGSESREGKATTRIELHHFGPGPPIDVPNVEGEIRAPD